MNLLKKPVTITIIVFTLMMTLAYIALDDYSVEPERVTKQVIETGSEDKFGLSEKLRRRIWVATIIAENRSLEEANEIYPLPNPSEAGFTQESFMSQFNKQSELEQELREKYYIEILEAYQISRDQFDNIGTEGAQQGWPFPKQ